MTIQLLKFNLKSNILVRQLLNLVIFHLALNKPYLLLFVFWFVVGFWFCFVVGGFFFIFLSLSGVLNGCY